VLILALSSVGVSAPIAQAQSGPEPGVTVDPNSPAGKEYALPVPSARQQAQGKTKKKSSNAPLFGEGVTTTQKSSPPPSTTSAAPTTTQAPPAPATSSSSSTSSSAKASAAKKHKRRKHERAKKKKRAAAAATTRSSDSSNGGGTPPAAAPAVAKLPAGADSASSTSGIGSSLVVGGLGLAVLLLGGLTGLALRRRLRTQ
jgi:hypothetical protein